MTLRHTEAPEERLRSVTLSRDGASRYFAQITSAGVALSEAPNATVAAVSRVRRAARAAAVGSLQRTPR